MDDKVIENQGKEAVVVIRADGNADIGVGHLMRCLTIAEYIREHRHVVFWCADEASAALARSRGYEVSALGTDYRDMPSELPRLEQLIYGREQGPERKRSNTGRHNNPEDAHAAQTQESSGYRHITRVILVDSYFVTAEYLQALGAYGRVYLLEDMPGHIWPVDGVINYNAFADVRSYEEIYRHSREKIGDSALERVTQLYIGASYVPIRSQFVGWDYQVQVQVKKLLVTTGGGDGENIAGKILERLEDMACQIHVVSGPYNPHGAWLVSYAQDHPQVVVHQRVEDMAKLMLQCDLAVTAGGTTVYELCALGVPFVCFSYAENQEALTEYVGMREVGLNAGKYHLDSTGTLERIGNLARRAAVDLQMRLQMSQRAKRLVDGYGAKRLAAALLESGSERI